MAPERQISMTIAHSDEALTGPLLQLTQSMSRHKKCSSESTAGTPTL